MGGLNGRIRIFIPTTATISRVCLTFCYEGFFLIFCCHINSKIGLHRWYYNVNCFYWYDVKLYFHYHGCTWPFPIWYRTYNVVYFIVPCSAVYHIVALAALIESSLLKTGGLSNNYDVITTHRKQRISRLIHCSF